MATPATPPPSPSNVTPIGRLAAQQGASQSQAAAANASAWTTQQGAPPYDRSNYYVQPKDNGGQYVHMRLKVKPHIHQAIMTLKDDPRHRSYKSPDDVVRDALVHLIHLRQDLSGTMPTLQQQEALDAFNQEQEVHNFRIRMDHCKTMLTDIKANWDDAVQWKAWEDLKASIETQRLLGEGAGWQGEFRGTLQRMCNEYEARIPKDIIF